MSDCVICHETLAASGQGCRTLECNHVFHESCILELRRFAPTWLCPICRHASPGILTVSQLYEGAIASLRQKAYGEFRHQLFEILDEVEPGYGKANFLIGWTYLHGVGVEKNNALALQYLQKADQVASAQAAYTVAAVYFHGIGVKKSNKLVLCYMKKAHEKGFAIATYDLGLMYYFGTGVKEDTKVALSYLKKAYLAGNEEAANALGVLYWIRSGIKNKKLAHQFFQKGKARNSTAERRL